MSSSSDIGPPSPDSGSGSSRPAANWREAIMALVATRIDLIQLEAKSVAGQKVKQVSFIAAAAGCLVFTWMLLLTGGIAWISEVSGWPWSRIAIAAAALHGLAAIIFAKMAKAPLDEAFPVTKAEFRKDREWIENFHKPRKSGD